MYVGGFDHHPTVVFRPTNATDVARVVEAAADSGAELAVRSGGHSSSGHGVSDGGITIDLSAMRSLEIDPEARTARAETGLTAGEYTTAAGKYGLATGFGDAGTVGIGGITTGGGVGFLSRRFGLTIDDVLSAEVVTADGRILDVDSENHPDLFWAIRGGGGNFGVVTRFTYRLHDVPSAVGGMLVLPATPEVIDGLLAAATTAPEELSVIANVMTALPMPFIPEEHHGKLVVLALFCYAGNASDGEQALAPFRSLATPLADMVRPITYPEMYPPAEEGFHPTAITHTGYADTIDDTAIGTILDGLTASTAAMRAVQIRPLGGAIDRVPADATAYAHRGRPFMVNVATFYDSPADRPERAKWATDLATALHNGADGAYVNFLDDDGAARIRAAYPGATWDRLVDVKRRYDPANLFHLNHNIVAADSGS